MTAAYAAPVDNRFNWELSAQAITVRIRWFGICVGFAVAWLGDAHHQPLLIAILLLGAVYALLDTWFSFHREVFLARFPLFVSLMEAVFIGLLCHFESGLHSPFRFYYFLSLLVCAMRYPAPVTWCTLGFHTVSFAMLLAIGFSRGQIGTISELGAAAMMLVFMGWVTWASTALVGKLKQASAELTILNQALQENQALLEQRIEERTRQLQESQAMIVQQEKQAAFGLLAAGIAHEVGNPLAAISSLMQLLKRRNIEETTREKLQLVDDQLGRIQRTLRELVAFSRPASSTTTRCDLQEAISAALNIAKYYKRKKGKTIVTDFAEGLPTVHIVRDQLVQVILNLVLNALDATEEGSEIRIRTLRDGDTARIIVQDQGRGIPLECQARLFQPYFTTKDTGTGLGLFVCRSIVEQQLHGSIELTESTPSGTTFTVTVPLNTALPTDAQPDTTRLTHAGL